MGKEVIYIRHQAGTFEDGLQICVHCGKIICDYTGHWVSADGGSGPMGFPEGAIWVTGTNPIQWTIAEPMENYGGDDPYIRKIVNCV